MLKKVYIFVNTHGSQYRSPLFCGDAAEYVAADRSEECRISWKEIDEIFQKCNTYLDFIDASVEVQGHYRSTYYCGSPYPQTCQAIRVNEVLDVVADEIVYIIQNRDRHGKRDILNRLHTLLRFNQYREKVISALDSAKAEQKALTPYQERQQMWLNQNCQLYNQVAYLLVEDSDVFGIDETDFAGMSILNGCEVKESVLRGVMTDILYSGDGTYLASDKSDLLPNLHYFVRQKAGYCEDDYYGTIYVPRNKAMTSFIAIPYAC